MLPKFLNSENLKKVFIKSGNTKSKNKEKDINDVINNIQINEYNLIDFDKIDLKKYEQKNKMSLSEIFLKFFEFIGFYFNYKYVWINAAFDEENKKGQEFLSKRELNNISNKNYALKRFKTLEKKKGKKDFVFIMEPFDYTYSPTHEVNNKDMDKIQKIFREIYFNMIKNGKIY